MAAVSTRPDTADEIVRFIANTFFHNLQYTGRNRMYWYRSPKKEKITQEKAGGFWKGIVSPKNVIHVFPAQQPINFFLTNTGYRCTLYKVHL